MRSQAGPCYDQCGVEPLDRYLRAQASQDVRRRVASCFVLIDDSPAPLAYCTLAATSLALSDLSPYWRSGSLANRSSRRRCSATSPSIAGTVAIDLASTC